MIVKTKQFAVKPMTPEEAVLQLELIGHDFFVFQNADTLGRERRLPPPRRRLRADRAPDRRSRGSRRRDPRSARVSLGRGRRVRARARARVGRDRHRRGAGAPGLGARRELDFRVLGDGSVIGDVAADVLARAHRGSSSIEPAVRRPRRAPERAEWMVGADPLRVRRSSSSRRTSTRSRSRSAIPPEGETMYIVDGEILARGARRASSTARRARARAARRGALSGIRRACR